MSAALSGGASAATICVGASPTCPVPDYPFTETGLQDALNFAASSAQSPGADVVAIGPGTLDISSVGVATMPPVGEPVAIQGSGIAATTILAGVEFWGYGFNLNFKNEPTSTLSNATIQVDGYASSLTTGVRLAAGGTAQSLKFNVTSVSANGAYGITLDSSATEYGGSPTCSGCEFQIAGPEAVGVFSSVYSGHTAEVNQSTFERQGSETDSTVGIRNTEANTTTNVSRSLFSGLRTALWAEIGTLDTVDSYVNLGTTDGNKALSVEYPVNNNGGRIINGNLDGVTVVGTGANQIGVDVHANTTNVLHEYGNANLVNTAFYLTGTGANDVMCTQLNHGEGSIGLKYSYVQPTSPVISGTCSTDISDTIDSTAVPPGFVDAGLGNFIPEATSALVDAGDALTSQTGRAQDVIGGNRFVNEMNGGTGGRIDIGAFEYQGPPPDTEPPVITITAPTNGTSTVEDSVTVTYTATDNYGDPPTCNISSGSQFLLQLGPNTITVTCEDAAENVGTASVNVTKLDTTPPVVTITAPADGSSTTASSVVVNFTATDDSGTVTSCTRNSGNSISLPIGTHQISVSCDDPSGNTGTGSVTVTRLDITPPDVTISAPVHNSSTINPTVTLLFSAIDDSGVAPSCDETSGDDLALSFGENVITVTCTDGAGNVGTGQVTVTRIDGTPPVVTITAPIENAITDLTAATLTYAATDDTGIPPSCNHTSGSSQPLVLGLNTITVTCNDPSGNTANASVNVWRVTDAEPVITILSPADGLQTTDEDVVLTYTALDGIGNPATCDIASGATHALSVGANTLTITCTDPSNNEGTESITVTRLDGVPPVVAITSPSDGLSTGAESVTVNYTATDNSGEAPTCNVADGASESLNLGANTITVQCSDSSGNTASDSVGVTRLDVTPPIVTITNPAEGANTTSDFVVLDYTATDNSGAAPTCTKASGSSQPLTYGSNTISFSCSDAAGNTTNASVTVTRIDSTPPDVNVITPTDGFETLDPSVVLTYTASDNSGDTPTCDKPTGTVESLNYGPNTITLTCSDAQANSTFVSLLVTRTDTDAPVVTITAPTDGLSTNSDSVVLEFTATDNSLATPTCDKVSGTSQDLVFGPNTITVTCEDATGNEGTDSVSVNRLDVVPPTVSITAPTDASTTNFANVTLVYTATDNSGVAPTCDKANGSSQLLALGDNTITVQCSDASGNTASDSVTITRLDGVPPVVVITSPTNNLNTSADSVTLNFTATDNSGETPSCDKTSGSTENLVFGPNTITVNCSDSSGNTGSASATVNRIDGVPPTVSITAPADSSTTTNATTTINFTATDNAGETPTCDTTDGGTLTLDFGANVLTVSCQDSSGNVGSDSVTVTRLDNTPPTVTITAPADSSQTSAPITTLLFTVSDDAPGTPTCDKVSGTSEALSFGPNTITVECTDGSGNTGSASVDVTRVDNTPPVVSITGPIDGSNTTLATTTLTFTVSDDAPGTPTCDKVSGSSQALVFGANTITVECTDGSGNTGSASVNVNRLDVVAPVVSITAPSDGLETTDASVTLSYGVTDNTGVAPTCDKVDGGSETLEFGPNTITVSCTDASGNTGTDSVSVTRTDETPPTINITAPTDGSTTTAAITTLVFTASDNSGSAPSCDKISGTSEALSYGANTITVTCTDGSSNSHSESVTITRLDNTAPVVSITAPVNLSTTIAASTTLIFSATDDTGVAPTCDKTSGSTEALSFGDNTFIVNCTDGSGNTGSASTTVTRLDIAPPIVTITAPSDGFITSDAAVTLTFTATDNSGSAPTCTKTSGSSQPLFIGDNPISVSCQDASGNTGSASITVTRLDVTPPQITITSPAADSSTTDALTTLTFTAVDDSLSTPTCDKVSGTSEALVFGENTITVECTDGAGNTGSASVTVTRLDNTPPTVVISSPSDGSSTASASIPLVFSASDDSGVAPTCDKTSGVAQALSFGANTLTVECSDATGNLGSASVVVTRLDITPPQVVITDPSGPVTTTDSSVSVSYTASDNTGVSPTCDAVDGGSHSLSFGANTITITCTDASGNTGTDSVSVTRNDNTPPSVTIDSPTDGSDISGASVPLTFTATDDSGVAPSCDKTSGDSEALSFGSNTLTVICTDGSGNVNSDSVTVTRLDNVGPTITITSPADGSDTTAATTTLSFTATDDSGTTPTCDKTSGASEALVFGPNTLSVTCTDGSANSATASVTITRLDVEPPTVSITAPADGSDTTNTSTVVNYTATDNSGAAPSCDAADGDSHALLFGANTVTVICTDGSGNSGLDSVSVTRLDNTPPVVSITDPADQSDTFSASVALVFTATDDSGATPTCDKTSGDSEALNFGSNTLAVTCTDGSGNSASDSIEVTRLDNAPPTIAITAPSDGSNTTAETATLTFTATDDSGVAPTCDKTSGDSVALLFGSNTITVTCTDATANSASESVVVTRLDNTPPVLTIDTPTDGSSTSDSSVTLTFSVSDDSGVAPTCDKTSGSDEALDMGANTISVTCTDGSGNSVTESVTVTRLDVTAPVITINSPLNGISTVADQVALDYSVTDDSGVAPTCDLANGSTHALSMGANTITVTCTDGSSNSSSASTTVTRTNDPPPVITISSPADGSTTPAASASLSYTVSDDSGIAPTCDRPNGQNVALAFGANTITLTCTDNAGGVSISSVTVTRADTTAPSISIVSPVDGSVSSTASVALSYTAADDSGVAPVCTPANGTVVSLALGANVIDISCTDEAGNSSVGSVGVTYAPPPSATPTPPPAAPAPPTKLVAFRRLGSTTYKRSGKKFRALKVSRRVRILARVHRASTVKLTVAKYRGGYKSGRKCVSRKPKRGKIKRCHLPVRGSQKLRMKTGLWMLDWGGKLGRKKLRPGRYLVTAKVIKTGKTYRFKTTLSKKRR